MLTAVIAFSIDAMLPTLPSIAADLSPDNINNAQLVLTAFVLERWSPARDPMGLGVRLQSRAG